MSKDNNNAVDEKPETEPQAEKETDQQEPEQVAGESPESEDEDSGLSLENNNASHYHVSLEESSKHNPFGWYRCHATGESTHIGMFDVRIHSKINRYSQETQQWEVDKYELQILWPNKYYNKLIASDNFTMEASDLLSKKAFQESVFKHSYKWANVKNDDEQGKFITFLTASSIPRDVYEFDYYGFIRHRGYHFYLTENALVTLDGDNYCHMVSPEEDTGMFRYPVEDGEEVFYVKPGRIEPAPRLELGEPDDGFYPTEGNIFTGKELSYFIEEVRDRFGKLVAGGEPEHKPEGYMFFNYMLSFLFMDEIYEEYQHVVYVYLYGKPSIGKGKLSQFALNFFGQDFVDVDSNPTLKSAENKLANHSRIPVIMDEFVPGEGKITAQIFNMWYELRQRGVSASYDRSKNQFTPVRSQLWFISNYKPTEDHFRSRCLMLEYTKSKRGDISHVWWFEKNKKDLQKLFVSLLWHYNQFDRELFKEELGTVKRELSKRVNKELERRSEVEGMSFNIKDRQLDNMAALITVDLFLCNRTYTDTLKKYKSEKRKFDNPMNNDSSDDTDKEFVEYLKETVHTERTDCEMFRYGIKHLALSAEKEISKSPMQQFLATMEVLTDKDELPVKNFQFNGAKNDGDLKIAWAKIWDAYEAHRIGRDKVNEDTVKAEIESIDKKGKATTHMINGVAQHGFRIPHYNLTASWYRAFGQNEKANELVNIEQEQGDDVSTTPPHMETTPF